MQYRVYDRKTLDMVACGYVAENNVEIDNDYLLCNNSKIGIVEKTDAKVGDLICLIKDSGAYDKGIITSVDNADYTISYKDAKELFNDNIMNPFMSIIGDSSSFRGKLGNLSREVAMMILLNWYDITDTERKLPIVHINYIGLTSGVWTYTDESLNMKDILVDYFTDYNLVLDFDIDFELKGLILNFSIPSESVGIIKDNMLGGEFVYEEETMPSKTVCVIYDDSYEVVETWYLKNDHTITTDVNDSDRMLPVKTVYVKESDSTSDTISVSIGLTDIDEDTYAEDDSDVEEETSNYIQAKAELIESNYNELVQLEINKDTRMIDFDFMTLGSKVTIVNELGTIDTIYTGRKENSASNSITLMFGKSRKNYTDKIQLALRGLRRSE